MSYLRAPYRDVAGVLEERRREAKVEHEEVLSFARGLRCPRGMRIGRAVTAGVILAMAVGARLWRAHRVVTRHRIYDDLRDVRVLESAPITEPPTWPQVIRHGGPTLRQGGVQVDGPLPIEVVERVVRQNFGRFRLCYENGLLGYGEKLTGRVTMRFVIDRDGSVLRATDDGSDLAAPDVAQCVTSLFMNLSFPMPERGGKVSVVYPILFAPSDAGGGGP